MNERTKAAARLLSEKIGLDLPPELIALALGQLSGKAAAGKTEPAPQHLGSVVDTRPLAGIVGRNKPPAGDDLSELLPQLLKQFGSSSGPNRRAELAAAASLIGALLGGSNKKPS